MENTCICHKFHMCHKCFTYHINFAISKGSVQRNSRTDSYALLQAYPQRCNSNLCSMKILTPPILTFWNEFFWRSFEKDIILGKGAFYSVSVFLVFDTNGFVYENFGAIGRKQNLHENWNARFSWTGKKLCFLWVFSLFTLSQSSISMLNIMLRQQKTCPYAISEKYQVFLEPLLCSKSMGE